MREQNEKKKRGKIQSQGWRFFWPNLKDKSWKATGRWNLKFGIWEFIEMTWFVDKSFSILSFLRIFGNSFQFWEVLQMAPCTQIYAAHQLLKSQCVNFLFLLLLLFIFSLNMILIPNFELVLFEFFNFRSYILVVEL